MDNIIKIHKLSNDAQTPLKATEYSVGYDLFAYGDYTIFVGECVYVSTQLTIELPIEYEAQIRPRSGLATSKLIIIPNSPGTIDSDYRGEIKVALFNLGKSEYKVVHGDRIAQMVISRIAQVYLVEDEAIKETEKIIKAGLDPMELRTLLNDPNIYGTRGTGGFGSTGV